MKPGILASALLATVLTGTAFAQSGTPKFYLDAEIQNLDQPFIGLNLDVTASVTYTVSGAGSPAVLPIKSKGSATFADSPLAADRMRIANERAIHQNIEQLLQMLR